MRWLFFIFPILLSGVFYAQDVIENDSAGHRLLLGIESESFFKNNEYFSPYNKGSTNIGFIIQPQLRYILDKKSSFSLGYHFLKYSGLNSFSEAIPLFNIRYRFNNSFEFIIGHIDGAADHKLSEPHYQRDQHFQNNVEYGLQFLFINDWLKSDTWLSWERFIQKNDPFPEAFIFGNKSSITLLNQDKINIMFDKEWMFAHIGGQIDYPSDTDGTLLNASFGLIAKSSINKELILGLKFYAYVSKVLMQISNPQNPNFYPYEKGSGFLFASDVSYRQFTSQIAFWKARKYISAIGEPLFSSTSAFDLDFRDDNRTLINYSLAYDKDLSDYINIALAFRSYYHLDQQLFDYSYELTVGLKLFRSVL